MGKSTVAQMFRDAQVPVFDADAAVHLLQGPGGALVPQIEAAFPGTTGPQGVDRSALGAAVFGDADLLSRLEAIVHPAVAQMREAFLRENAQAPLVILDIPLLYEKGHEGALDGVAVVSAPEAVQRARVLGRPGMTVEKFERIRALQVPDDIKRARADTVIDTGLSLAETRGRVNALIRTLIGAQ